MCDSPLVLHHPFGHRRCVDCFYTSGDFGNYPQLHCDNPLISNFEGHELVQVSPYFSCRHFMLGPYDEVDGL